ncbi:GGDEF domain-containing protein [Roseibium sediminicola]|uniref:diguanylate cyclase n=1 Tax=Roseibium sediminicola TaxID=2933272 RepID=A0ABT0H1Y7_9HYPH|nr:GGDEF domain-containing protein [Roseibium sp. CAU 1639]MCK7615707.1 GGDEF domain-containing protein [Roseibium sp. CAU 1639]
MTIKNSFERLLFVFVTTLVSVTASLLLSWAASANGLDRATLIPAVGVPLMVAPTVSFWIATMMLRIQDLNRQLLFLARHDDMTALLTRRAFFEEFGTTGTSKAGSIIVADIDRFKAINDTYGHKIGDRVIREVANILKDKGKSDGISARFGGEEFVSFYPDECLQHAAIRAEAIRSAVENQSIQVSGKELGITLSIGVDFFDGTRPLDEVLHAADQALYEAKKTGRNKVVSNSA